LELLHKSDIFFEWRAVVERVRQLVHVEGSHSRRLKAIQSLDDEMIHWAKSVRVFRLWIRRGDQMQEDIAVFEPGVDERGQLRGQGLQVVFAHFPSQQANPAGNHLPPS